LAIEFSDPSIEKIFFTRRWNIDIRGANGSLSLELTFMSTSKEQLEVEDEFTAAEAEDAEPVVEVAKTNLSKRRTIDNMLEERRLQKQLADYDFDL
jgi:hypothetical protein